MAYKDLKCFANLFRSQTIDWESDFLHHLFQSVCFSFIRLKPWQTFRKNCLWTRWMITKPFMSENLKINIVVRNWYVINNPAVSTMLTIDVILTRGTLAVVESIWSIWTRINWRNWSILLGWDVGIWKRCFTDINFRILLKLSL